MKLQGKTVLVTGGSKGIGEAIVRAVAAQGANVIINYAHDKVTADKLANEITEVGVKCVAVQADVTNQQEVDSMFETVKATFGSLDMLVNNAGIFDESDGPDNMAAFESVFAANFFGAVRVVNGARQLMQQGKIVFISSIHGKLGNGSPDSIAYSASKCALDSYMKNLAKAVAPNILVNSIAPGRTITPMWGEMDDDYKAKMADGHLIERWIQPAEIADAVLFLAANDAICGEVLVVDGGMSLKVLG